MTSTQSSASKGVPDAALLEARGVSKTFPGVRALDAVDFAVCAGEVVALVGENGAGKSTLMKVLAGLHQPDEGGLAMNGGPVALGGPIDAMQRGIALIHQELSLCENLTVSGAMFLGAELRRGPFLREQEMAAATAGWLARLGLDADPRALVSSLRMGQRQLLEIARALRADAKVLIMDEPTSSLTDAEARRLFEVVKELRRDGVGIVYITHRLAEIETIADRVVGLRDGRNSGALEAGEITQDRMVALMVGRDLAGPSRTPHPPGEVVLEVCGLKTHAWPDAAVDLQLRRGEVVGVAGLLGAGRTEVLRALFGVDKRAAGEVVLEGQTLRSGDVRGAIASGLGMLPEDRKSEGLVSAMSVRENVSLPTLRARGAWLDRGYDRATSATAIEDLLIACSSGEQQVSSLSGGNQQKVVLGKWLAASPSVLLLDEPTRGVDVGARAEIYRRLDGLARAGLAILFVSSELDEVLQLADRVLVLREGAVVGDLTGADRTEAQIMMLATGALAPQESR
ncbi:MAG: D-xylose ABC transporter ATP-binding protein [Planctomycetes bacterium]|nr:D-xylose ABC transporter ATP-binding protein [Planctomycetota bacterium]